jgi:PKD repeat protein
MQRNLLFILICLVGLFSADLHAQGVSINESGAPANNKAMLDIDRIGKGVLIPRMTQTFRDTITVPPTGLLIFNTTTNCFNFWNANQWFEWCGNCIPPASPVPGSNSPICQGATLNLTASPVPSASYYWVGPNSFTSNTQNPSITNAQLNANGAYSVYAIVLGCTSAVATHTVVVTPGPNSVFAAPSVASVNVGAVFTGPTVGGATYAWTFPSGSPGTSTTQSPTVTWTVAGTYTVSLTVTLAGCNSTSTQTISVIPAYQSCWHAKQANPGLTTGVYLIDPDLGGPLAARNCFCEMTLNGGGFASIFDYTANPAYTGASQCLFNWGNDDHDSYIMWSDLTTKICNANIDNTNGANWFTWNRNQTQNMTAAVLPAIPAGTGANARPVPMPLSNSVAWFDWQNSVIRWNGQNITMASVGMTPSWVQNYGTNYYFITDGVSEIVVGQGASARHLRFDYVANTITGSAATAFAPVQWWATEEDAFGCVLWTVKGRVFYYDRPGTGSGTFTLGGTMTAPAATFTDFALGCVVGGWCNTQHQLDFFGMVDNAGFLWFVDWGHDNSGFFNCGNDNFLGVRPTNISLTY